MTTSSTSLAPSPDPLLDEITGPTSVRNFAVVSLAIGAL